MDQQDTSTNDTAGVRRRGGAGAPTAAATTTATATSVLARWVTALAVLVSAVLHLKLWADGMRDVDVVGPAFLLNAVGGVAIALVVVVWRHWLPLLAAAGFGAATLGAYAMSRTVGLFDVKETIWTTEAVVSAVVELLAMVGAFVAWRAERRRA